MVFETNIRYRNYLAHDCVWVKNLINDVWTIRYNL